MVYKELPFRFHDTSSIKLTYRKDLKTYRGKLVINSLVYYYLYILLLLSYACIFLLANLMRFKEL